MDEQKPDDRNHLIEFIAATVEAMRDQMATKSDLRQVEQRMATKSDLRQVEERMVTRMDAGFAAVRGDIERVASRLDQVDRNQSLRTAALESDIKRIRSVVYVLAKDQPDLVRMLGPEF